MKKLYEAPISELIDLITGDVITASPIQVAGINATGYEDGGDISSVFNINV